MPQQSSIIAVIAAVLYATGAFAGDPGTPLFSFSGFGTLGVVHSSDDQADFTSRIFNPNGAGYSHTWSTDVDSRIGAQVTVAPTAQLSAVAQVISAQNYDDTYRPHVEWANIKYQFTPDFSVRLGRTVLPAFLLTDTLQVGYTYPWVRPPLELYRVLPVTNIDGLDVNYRLNIGKISDTMRANVGRNDTQLPDGEGTAQARRSWGLSNTVEYGSLTAHVTYQKTYLTIASLNALFGAFRQFGPQGVAIANEYDSEAKPFPTLAFGAGYDPGQWFVMSEWAHGDTNSSLGKRIAWYASSGYRFGPFTPYVIYAKARADNLSDPGLTVSALPPFLAGPATGLNAALNSLLREKTVQNTISIGSRWDFMRNIDLKLQFDHTNIGAGSTGVLINTQPGFQPGGTLNVFSAVVDFVF